MGETLERFLQAFERVNLLERWPGRQAGAKGHLFDLAEARRRAGEIDLRGRVVVLAGKRVASACGLRDPAWLTPVRLGRGEVHCVVIPHPSGIVRWYNDPNNVSTVGDALREAVALAATRNPRR